MGYENWQGRTSLKAALETAPVRLPQADGSPSLRRRLAVVAGLGMASWAVLIGGVSAVVWAVQSLGTIG